MKEFYYDRETTPLAFHNFIRFFWLPLNIITGIGSLFLRPYLNTLGSLNILLVALLVLTVISFVGFLNWESYGWKSFRILIFSMIGIGTLGSISWIIIGVLDGYNEEIGYGLGYCFTYLLFGLAFGIPTLIYYKRRKPLFYPDMQPPVKEEFIVSYVDPALTKETESKRTKAMPLARFCRHCGRELEYDAMFCPRCGTKVVHVGPEE
ncbi:MAG: zinc ribbon domain-containing protein [Firmicutes bacterium]|nr:zinc ribbon domain-containing protein [Bacillota bacterium]